MKRQVNSIQVQFGHCDSTRSWARHLVALRAVQARTRGITEFVPLPFVHMEAPIFLKGNFLRPSHLLGACRLPEAAFEYLLCHDVERCIILQNKEQRQVLCCVQNALKTIEPDFALQTSSLGCPVRPHNRPRHNAPQGHQTAANLQNCNAYCGRHSAGHHHPFPFCRQSKKRTESKRMLSDACNCQAGTGRIHRQHPSVMVRYLQMPTILPLSVSLV